MKKGTGGGPFQPCAHVSGTHRGYCAALTEGLCATAASSRAAALQMYAGQAQAASSPTHLLLPDNSRAKLITVIKIKK